MRTIREIRESKGITKIAVARHLGISRPAYDNYEAHPERMRIETAKSVAEFLGVDLSDIFFLADSK
jgi:DNA-binding XRE family transcriptional regulator